MKVGERECLDEVKKDEKKKTAEEKREQQRRDDGIIIVKISVDTREAYDIIEAITATKRCRTAWGAVFATRSYGNTAQFPPCGLSAAPAAAARYLRCQNAR